MGDSGGLADKARRDQLNLPAPLKITKIFHCLFELLRTSFQCHGHANEFIFPFSRLLKAIQFQNLSTEFKSVGESYQ